MDRFLVTESFWAEVTGEQPPPADKANHPKTGVSWFQAVAFCNLRSQLEGFEPVYRFETSERVELSEREVLSRRGQSDIRVYECDSNNGYRLPRSSEWKKAARDGKKGPLELYGSPSEIAVFGRDGICDVGTKQPTSRGIYDLWGLAYEWMGDRL